MMFQELKEISNAYEIDEICFIGNSEQRNSIVFAAQEKTTKYQCAIKLYLSEERPNYDQWCGGKLLTSKIELLPYFPKNIESCIGNIDMDFKDKLILMHTVCKKLEEYHKSGKNHGNIHPRNILLSQNLRTVAFMDSLKGGNKNTFYTSPQSQKGIFRTSNDVYSLGLIFLELLDSNDLKEKIIQISPIPCFQPLFPESKHLAEVNNPEVKKLLSLMLNRNYQQRITLKEIIPILRAIILNKINENNKKKEKVNININHIVSFIEIPFCLVHEEKLESDLINEKEPQSDIVQEITMFNLYKDKKIVFEKNYFKFQYLVKENQLIIELSHSSGVKLKETYLQSQLSKQAKSRMGLRKLVILMYHTPEDMFEVCLSGKLLFRLSDRYQSMSIDSLLKP